MLLAPQVMRAIWAETQGQCTICTDVAGAKGCWETQDLQHTRTNQLITSGGLGRWALRCQQPSARSLGRPRMKCGPSPATAASDEHPEMATVMQEGLNIKIAVVNNSFLGMVRQWQELIAQ